MLWFEYEVSLIGSCVKVYTSSFWCCFESSGNLGSSALDGGSKWEIKASELSSHWE
jgi:hypothetical protein